MKVSKKLLIILSVILLLIGVAIAAVYEFSGNSDISIPDGYIDKTGNTDAGRDLDEYYCYTYNAMPRLGKEYQLVTADNIESLYTDISDYEKQAGQGHFSDKVSEGDYFITVYYDQDGNVIDYSRQTNVKIYLYDIETNSLYYVYYSF